MLLQTSTKIACFRTLKIVCFCLSFCLSCLQGTAREAGWFQTVNTTIKGKVLDASNGEPITGVSVVVAGTIRGATTNAAGEYEIEVDKQNAELEFSSVNYVSQKIKVGQQRVLDVSLQLKPNALGEVVVVGYGRQKRVTLTGSVSEVRGSELIKSPDPNVASNLAGRLPGVVVSNFSGQPGADDPSIIIRGINSFSGGTSPLIVIDGVAGRPGGFSRLNPNDIESITVLKDASAAIYGAQAANGVILVTTKRGISGPTKVNFAFNQGFNTLYGVPERINSFEFATLQNEENEYQGSTPTYSPAELQKFKDGSDPIGYPSTNWLKEVYRPVAQQHSLNVSLSGGNGKTSYYASLGKTFKGGAFHSNAFDYNQYNLSLNLDAQINNVLKISFDNQVRYSERREGISGAMGVFRELLYSLPTLVARYPDGRLGAGAGSLYNNPLATTTEIGGSVKYYNLTALNTLRFRVDIPQVKGLFADGFVAADLQYSDDKRFGKTWDAYTYNRNTQEYGLVRQSASSEGLASLGQNMGTGLTLTVNSRLNYARVLNKVHSFSSFVMFEQQQIKSRYFGADRRNFITDNVAELDYGSRVNMGNYGGSFNTARRNFSAKINYAYDNKYLLELVARYDGSDKFSKDQRWGFFPGVSAGWRIGQESWAQGFVKENELKLTASFGILGNDAIGQYQFLQFYNLNPSGYLINGVPVPTISPGVLGNPDFTWEKQKTYNVAIEGTALRRSFNYKFELFRQVRTDILGSRSNTVPDISGLILPIVNYGKMQSQGIEFQLGYTGQIGDVKFTTGANFTYSNNKVLIIDEPLTLPDYYKSTGRNWNSQYLFRTNGLFQSKKEVDDYLAKYDFQLGGGLVNLRPGDVVIKDLNGDNIINNLDQELVDGSNTPTTILGSTTSLNWKGFELSFLLQGQLGRRTHFYPLASNQFNYLRYVYEGRSTPTQVTDQPTMSSASFNRAAWVGTDHPFFYRNTSFVRLKNVEFAYTLRFGKNNSTARLYVNGNNLLTYSPGFGKIIDPEQINQNNYPMLRTFNVGANVSF